MGDGPLADRPPKPARDGRPAMRPRGEPSSAAGAPAVDPDHDGGPGGLEHEPGKGGAQCALAMAHNAPHRRRPPIKHADRPGRRPPRRMRPTLQSTVAAAGQIQLATQLHARAEAAKTTWPSDSLRMRHMRSKSEDNPTGVASAAQCGHCQVVCVGDQPACRETLHSTTLRTGSSIPMSVRTS